MESRLLIAANVYTRHGTDSAAAFLHHLTGTQDVPNTASLADDMDYLTALATS